MHDSLRLVACLAEYEHAERAVLAGYDYRRADKLHERLFDLAIRCGFKPGRDHWNLSLVEFAHQHADRVARTLANNVRAIRQDNSPPGVAA